MAIICLEGPSAVGKTSTARKLGEEHGAIVVKEIGSRFPRPQGLTPGTMAEQQWFWSCNVKRWQIAIAQERHHALVVFDGDPLKLWYDWIYGIDPSIWEEAVRFYRNRIQARAIGFPDSYCVLVADNDALRYRKSHDATRKRGNFEKHWALIEPQQRLYAAVGEAFPGSVTFIQAITVEGTVNNIMEMPRPRDDNMRYSLSRWDFMVQWMVQNPGS